MNSNALPNRRSQRLAVAVAAGTFLFAGGGVSARAADPAKPAARPNVLVIVTDDEGYNDFGFQGSPDIKSPNIDALANHGVRFTNAYVTAPICGASRAGLISGRYQQRHSYEGNPNGSQGLAITEATIADSFHAGGYATGAVGKWSIGSAEQFRPQKRGFDEFFGFLGMMHPYVPGVVDPALRMVGESLRPGWGADPTTLPGGAATQSGRGNFAPGDVNATRPARDGAPGDGGARGGAAGGGAGGGAGGQPLIGANAGVFVRGNEEVTEDGYATEAFAREAISFINRHKDGPFFLYLAFNASHSPLQPTQKYIDRFPNLTGKRQLYAATTSALDDAVGSVVDTLRQTGQEDNTLIVFINDNGGPINDIAANNYPLSGAKSSLWEGGIRVPFFARWKGHFAEGVSVDQPVISLDVFPTLLAATGLPTPQGKDFSGVSLLPVLTSGKANAAQLDRTLYWRFNNLWAIREGKWKLTVPQRNVETPLLFNLEADIGENANLAAQYPAVVKHLSQEYAAWNAQNLPLSVTTGRGGAQSQPANTPAALPTSNGPVGSAR